MLLDAFEALRDHAEAVILAGAQAVYLHTGAGELAVTPFTTDGDLALDPQLLGGDPQLEAVMEAADFHLHLQEPGIWLREIDVGGSVIEVPVDLIVPSGVASRAGRRGARLGPHGARAARKIDGLEAALVDHGPMTIAALDPADARAVTAKVAGPTALLIAKAHKLNDRIASGKPSRLDDKDAVDCFRIMQTVPPATVAAALARLVTDPVAGPATRVGWERLEALFGRRSGLGVVMATRALRIGIPAEQVAAISVGFMRRVGGIAADA
ncbi:MAG TPA: hypothetical protein VN238_13700 [Solirubrobacteraceae bacterium]|nr:hypothetical protein [Solirubrobacteraceae bacterium]